MDRGINRPEYVRRQTSVASFRLVEENPDLQPSLEAYMKGPRFRRLGPNSQLGYLIDLGKFFRSLRPGQAPTGDDLKRFLETSAAAGLSRATLARRRAVVAGFLAFQNPGRKIALPEIDPADVFPSKERRLLSADDVKMLLHKAQHPLQNTRDPGIVAVAAGTGATGDQIISLNREDVAAAGSNVLVQLGIPKPRLVSLEPPYGRILMNHAQTLEDGQALFQLSQARVDRPDDPPLTYAGLNRFFHRLGEQIDWRNLNPRDFRMFFLSQRGYSVKEIARELGVSTEQAGKYYRALQQ